MAAISAIGTEEQAGKVFVYRQSEVGEWVQEDVLAGSDTEAGDGFGATIALDGDLLLVGAPEKDDSKGAVHVFQFDADQGVWQEKTKLSANDDSEGSQFGYALALDKNRLYVGAPSHDQRAGIVYSYEYDVASSEWSENGVLTAFDASPYQRFGYSLHEHDGSLWVGAPGFSRSKGALYVYGHDEEDEDWGRVTKIKGSDIDSRAYFGAEVAAAGTHAVVGATRLSSGAGAAYAFAYVASEKEWVQEDILINEMKSFPPITGQEVACEGEKAGEFDCNNVDILSFVPIKDIGGERGVRLNDIWGWTDPETGKEYALVGRSNGTSFVDVTDPFHPVYIGDLPKTEGSIPNVWRDIKVYKNHAFIVADGAGDHGMQVFDLEQLRTASDLPVTFEETAHYDNIASAHNVVINEDTGYAYIVGSSSGGETCGGGLHMVNIQDPARPVFSGCFADTNTGRRNTGYSHDAQCVIYRGPDIEHQGKEVCFGANETALSIADVTDKENPVALSVMSYPKVAYSHQGWLTEDQRYFYMNDEGDEVTGLVPNTRTLIWDVADLDDPILVKEHLAETTSMDHNLYIKGNLMYQSNYDSGFRILDINDPENPDEVGFFDTTPFEGTGGGSWSNYPYFESGAIIVSSSYEGLFVLKKSDVVF